jgi:3',5'-cyclic AMP phosphodiesterase CpdA
MRLLAISDLHLANPINRAALADVPDYGDDWLILCGDIAERDDHLEMAFQVFTERFQRVIWVPGNHELWSVQRVGHPPLRGLSRYRHLVAMARRYQVITPEDPYPHWPPQAAGQRDRHIDDGAGLILVPMFLLYDYSFRPDNVGLDQVRAWAAEQRAACSDEIYLSPEPFASRQAWCADRLAITQKRLEALDPNCRTILINHWPLRQDLVYLPRAPRFAPWCGTRATEDWHRQFRADVVVSGHLHIRRTDDRDGCRFEEVSLGHPRQWRRERGIAGYFREIVPATGLMARPADLMQAAAD